MRSDVVKRHMKVHVKRNEIHPTTKIQYNEIDVSTLRKMLEKETVRYKNKISLGKALDKILDEGIVMEAVLPKVMQNALNLYRNNIGVDVEMEEVFEREESENVEEYEDEKEMNVDDEENEKESENENEMNVEEESEDEIVSEDGKFDICNDYSDIWVCYNCNRWETDERCQICNNEALELYERERESI